MHSLAVFGSLQEIRSKLQDEQSYDFSAVTIQPPLEFMRSNENPGLFVLTEDLDFLSQDICFISSETLNKEEILSYLKNAEIEIAPLSNDFNVENDEDDIFEVLDDNERDVAEDIESLMFDNLVETKTLQDALRNRVMVYSQRDLYSAIDKHLQKEEEGTDVFVDMNDGPALIEAKNSILSRLIPSGSGYASLFLAESEFDPETESMEFTLNSEIHALTVIRLNFEIDNGAIRGISVNPQGKYILASSSITTYMLENFAPGIVICTSVSPEEDKIQLKAWYSNPDGYDGVFPEISSEWFDSFVDIAEETGAIIGQDIPPKENISFIWSENIPGETVPLLPNVLPQEEINALHEYVQDSIGNLIEEYEQDENNDDND